MVTNTGYEFYLDGILLPITPARVETRVSNKNKVVTLLNGEELNLLKRPKLKEFKFEARLPSEDYPAVKQFVRPTAILKKLEDLKNNKKSFQFIIIRTPYQPNLDDSINKKVTLESYRIIEDARNGADLLVEIDLKAYIPIRTKIVNTKADGGDVSVTDDAIDGQISAFPVIEQGLDGSNTRDSVARISDEIKSNFIGDLFR